MPVPTLTAGDRCGRLSNNGFNLETEAEIRKAWGTRDGTLELSKPVKEASARQSASLLNVKKFCVNIVR
jgi:hypothetical protein